MKKFLLLSCLSVLVFSGLNHLSAQSIDSMMGVYADRFPQQKIYVHFDKSVYRPGESIWFKAYLFSGFEPSGISRTFFAELVDKNGTVVQRKMYPIIEASAGGNFEIPATQNANLSFRAYTNWMLNFDTTFLFKREINIAAGKAAESTKPVEQGPTQLSFFAEGGDMVADIDCMVAFKANDKRGKPVAVTGEIKSSKGEVVAKLLTLHDGMGAFNLTPVKNETYTAYFTDEFGKQSNAALPLVKNSGIVLHVNPLGDKKVFIVKKSPEGLENLTTVNIVAHMAQHIVYKAKVPFKETTINSGSIPTNQLPTGILQITVFNEAWEPLAERIVFVNNNNYRFDAELTTPIVSLEKRGKNIFEVLVKDTLLTNMSVSITDAEIGTTSNGDNIISGLLISGDLKGYIHNPTYYSNNTEDTTLQNLDLLMLTHGWRRFNWSNIARGRTPFLKYPTDPPLSMIAKVFGVNPSSPIRADETMTVILQTKDSSTQILQLPKTGPTEFSLRNFIFYDTLKVFYQFNKDQRLAANTSLIFDNGLYKGPRVAAFPELPARNIDSLTIKRAEFFADQIYKFGDGEAKVNVLQEVIVKTRARSKAEELDKKYASGLFAGGDATVFDFVNDPNNSGFQDIFSYLQGRVAGLLINGAGANATLTWRGATPTTFLNEMQVDAQTISTISVADIAYIKVFRPPFFGAPGGGAGGAIAIYTRKGGDQPVTPGKGLDKGTLVGYSIMKEFYSPNYSDPQTEISSDLRSTLYWNPFVFTDASKPIVKFEFYNNDISKAFRIILEGVNEFGKLIRIEKLVK